jgi:periplasmic divalent cation tolerance protein
MADQSEPDRRAPLPVPEPVRIPPPNSVLVVFTTLPDEETAGEIADALVGEHLAACVTTMAPCRSVYRWRGEVEEAAEVPLLIKTAADRYPALQARLKELHPYDVPEILAWRPDAGWPGYADWVIAETRAPRRWPR